MPALMPWWHQSRVTVMCSRNVTDVTEGFGFAEGGKHSNVSVTLPISPLTLPSMCSLSSTPGDLILDVSSYALMSLLRCQHRPASVRLHHRHRLLVQRKADLSCNQGGGVRDVEQGVVHQEGDGKKS